MSKSELTPSQAAALKKIDNFNRAISGDGDRLGVAIGEIYALVDLGLIEVQACITPLGLAALREWEEANK